MDSLEINGHNCHWSGGSEFCRCCEGGIRESFEHVVLGCTLCEGERGRLFQGVGVGWSGVDKMRVVLSFSDGKGSR